MVRKRGWNVAVVGLSALLVVAFLGSEPVSAETVPIKIRGAGVGPEGLPLPGEEPRPHTIAGEATHLGRHEGKGTVRTDTAILDLEAGVITGEFGSGDPFVFVGADGDKLVCHYGRTDKGASQKGTFLLKIVGFSDRGVGLVVEAFWIAEFVPQPELCTGRFAGVTGGWTMYAWSKPFVLGTDDKVEYAWQGEGQLEF
jgi:hypothetical protein